MPVAVLFCVLFCPVSGVLWVVCVAGVVLFMVCVVRVCVCSLGLCLCV